MKNAEHIKQVAKTIMKDYGAKLKDTNSLLFKSVDDMKDAADDIADTLPFTLDFDEMSLEFLSESALDVATATFNIHGALNEADIKAVAMTMQINESEEIDALVNSLYDVKSKRSLCAHLGIPDLPDADRVQPDILVNESGVYDEAINKLNDAPNGTIVTGGGYKFTKIDNRWISPKGLRKGAMQVADLLAGFSDFTIHSTINESEYEDNVKAIFERKAEIEKLLANSDLDSDTRKKLESELYQINANIGRHNMQNPMVNESNQSLKRYTRLQYNDACEDYKVTSEEIHLIKLVVAEYNEYCKSTNAAVNDENAFDQFASQSKYKKDLNAKPVVIGKLAFMSAVAQFLDI
jgi:hypothetical protein